VGDKEGGVTVMERGEGGGNGDGEREGGDSRPNLSEREELEKQHLHTNTLSRFQFLDVCERKRPERAGH
jgi:hypothetical protein